MIFQENLSFDHYFGTYPKATSTSGQPFLASRHTPQVNNFVDTKGAGGQGNLLTNNPAHPLRPHASVPRWQDESRQVLPCRR